MSASSAISPTTGSASLLTDSQRGKLYSMAQYGQPGHGSRHGLHYFAALKVPLMMYEAKTRSNGGLASTFPKLK